MAETPTITVHISKERVESILCDAGWQIGLTTENREPYYVMPGGRFRHDGGKFGVDYLWELDEAFTMQIEGQVPQSEAGDMSTSDGLGSDALYTHNHASCAH